MKKKLLILILLMQGIGLFLIYAGKNNRVSTGQYYQPPHYLKLAIPPGWPQPSFNIFANNPLSEEGFQLGRKLFYDGILSKDGNTPCASCHQQYAAFCTFDHDFSHGFNNSFTTRNAPALANLAWMPLLTWDGGANHIEVQPLRALIATNEMGVDLDSALIKLRNDPVYPRLFKAAFGDTKINSQRLLKALAQFTGSIISSNSKYDKVKRGEEVFTRTEERGYATFKVKCASCHKEPLFTDYSFRNNGLSLNSLNDVGRMKITGDKDDSLKFKVPSLRNVSLTFPYMHDGRLYTIGQVIDHYRNGIITSQATLDPLLRNRISISNNEKNDLIFFLYTLTDTTLTHNLRFAN